MHNLEKYGDSTSVDWSRATPNSLVNGIVIELRWQPPGRPISRCAPMDIASAPTSLPMRSKREDVPQ